jgi:hypothetical protein
VSRHFRADPTLFAADGLHASARGNALIGAQLLAAYRLAAPLTGPARAREMVGRGGEAGSGARRRWSTIRSRPQRTVDGPS